LIVNESVSAPTVTAFFKGLYEFKITSAQGDTTVKAYVSANNQQFKFKYNKTPNGVVVDPNNWVLNNTGSIINGGTIPVKLVSFDGNATNNCSVLLKWKTSNEQNIHSYEIEYSNNGSNYFKAGSIAGTNNNAETNYQFQYGLTSGNTSYFRLKIIESTGDYFYSPVVTVNKKCTSSFGLNLAPNPVTEKLVITITQPTAGKTTITLLNAVGSMIFKEVKILNAGENIIEMNSMNKYAPGTYLLRIDNSDGSLSKKFIIM